MHIQCAGQGSPTVVLESGGASSSSQWVTVQEAMATFTTVCAYDRPGFGWSDPAESALSFEQGARELRTLLLAADITGPLILVGHSKGGLHVRTYARLYPSDVAGVVLVDATEEEAFFGGPDILDSDAASARWLGRAARVGVLRLMLRFFPGLIPLPEIPEPIRPIFHAELSRPSYWKAVEREGDTYRLTPEKERVARGFGSVGEVPLIVITHGVPFTGGMAILEQGFLDAQKRLAALSSDSEFIIAEKSGHAIMWDEPDLIVSAVRRLVDATAPQG